MSIKTKKSIFAKDEEGTAPASEPYMVFETKEDYDEAVAAELESRAAEAQESEPVNEPDAAAPEDDSARLIALWQRDANMLKLIVPEFDLNSAVKNERFRSVLSGGGSVFEAYAEAIKPAEGTAGRDEIFQNAQNRSRGTGEAVINPAKLSPEEFRKYIEERRNA